MGSIRKMQRKVCSQCGVEKGLKEFHSEKRSKDGRTAACKDCRNGKNNARKIAERKAVDPRAEEKRRKAELELQINSKATVLLIKNHRAEFERHRRNVRKVFDPV
jgi:hypothetical protein